MAKSKKNRKSTLDMIKKVSKKRELNPFEMHVNKSKFKVLGQKSKNDVGMPGISRNKAIQKRKVTLLQEYKVQDKSNKFFDKRIGERNKNMTKEDKIMARFTAEKMKSHNKSMFNLDDDIVLTHQGRTLEEIEQFEDPRSDEEDDEDGRNMKGTLDANFVGEAHFGGGMLAVTSKDGELSRKDLISQLIAESKKRKADKQFLKESTMKLTEQLDTDWKDLLPIINPIKTTKPTIPPTSGGSVDKTKSNGIDKNSFDFLVQELRYEATGKPSNKLKSEDEVIRQDKERLEKLERERMKRMNLHGEEIGKKTSNRTFKSADDLDDGFAIEKIDDDEEMSEDENKNEDNENSDEDDNEQSDDEEEEGEDDDNYDNKIESKNKSNHIIAECKKEENGVNTDQNEDKLDNEKEKEVEYSEDDDNDDEEEKEDDDSFDDLTDNEEEDDEDDDPENLEEDDTNEKQLKKIETITKTKRNNESNKKKIRFSDIAKDVDNEDTEGIDRKSNKSILKIKDNENKEIELEKLKDKTKTIEDKIIETELETNEMDLPFTFDIPNTYEELVGLFNERSTKEIGVIMERMIKVNHWSLGGENKDKFKKFFPYLLQYLDDSVNINEPKNCWQVLNVLTPYLFDLTQMDPDNSGQNLRGVIEEKYNNFIKNERKLPSVDSLMFLKLVSSLFPTSDARHHVTTPAMVFILHTLGKGCVNTPRDAVVGMFLCTLAIEYIDLSNRYLPELINFIRGMLLMYCKETCMSVHKPFTLKNKKLFNINITREHDISNDKIEANELFSKSKIFNNELKIKILFYIINLIKVLINKYKQYDANYLIFNDILKILKQLTKENSDDEHEKKEKSKSKQNEKSTEDNSTSNGILSNKTKTVIDEKLNSIIMDIEKIIINNSKFNYLSKEKEKPKILRLFEPEIKPVMKYQSKGNKKEREVLLYKYKKEMKGAMREIRKDTKFINKIKINQSIKEDNVRKRKVKEIMNICANQEGEIRNIKRKK